LFNRFLKLVGRHFLQFQKVSDYAGMLFVSPDHLNRTIKLSSDKTCLQWIDQMILLEAKALLKHSELSISEISYKLKFSDPSHFNKFFKKHSAQTPLQYRIKPE
jgi:AraC-like DNA-binding protein